MKKSLTLLLLFAAAGLTACTSMPPSEYGTPVKQRHITNQGGAHVGKVSEQETAAGVGTPTAASGERIGLGSMDSSDKSKMSHALDKPLGKSTHWVNESTGVAYTVVPTGKVSINGNPYCRRYTTTSEKGDRKRENSGTACVGSDSNWESISKD
jgi:surface antigen